MRRDFFVRQAATGIAILGLALSTGCHRHDHDHEDHGHDAAHEDKDHHEEGAQLLARGEKHEVFVVHDTVIVETPAHFVTHVTELQTLGPKTDGSLRFKLHHAGEPAIEHAEKEPVRPGIYESTLTFPKPGEWTVVVVIPTQAGEETVKLPAIRVFASKEEMESAPEPQAIEGIHFTKEQQWKIAARIEPAGRRIVSEHVRLAATVAPRPGAMASVVAPVSGRLLPPTGKELPVPGQKVEAGELLALVQPAFSEAAAKVLEAEAEAIRAKAAVDQARLSHERTKKLAAAEAKSARELQESEFALRSAEAQFEAAKALQATYRKFSPQEGEKPLDLSLMELRSPIAGVITDGPSHLGAPVTPEKTLFTILKPGPLWLEARLPETRLARIDDKPAAFITMDKGREKHALQFIYLGMQVDAATRSVPIAFEVQNENQLRIGQAVELHVQTRVATNSLAIPDPAVVEEEGRFVVFVQTGGETFEKRDVTLGLSGGGFVQVVSGLEEGERVVTKGAYAIRLASVSSAIPAHGHAH